jgi:cytochrome c-type biogenesis protein
VIDPVDVVALFGAGVASFLAPCVVPLVPAWLGMVTGSSQRVVGSTLLFVLGFAAVFTALGTAAGAVGSSLDGVQNGLERVGGVVVAVFGLALLGILRGPFSRERRLVQRLPEITGIVRPVIVGVAFGAAWSPCVGPLLGAALVAAADAGSPGAGAALLGAYAAGIGVPFVLAALAIGGWPSIGVRLRRIAPRLERVAGGLLVVLGVLLATGAYGHLASYLARFTPTVGGGA